MLVDVFGVDLVSLWICGYQDGGVGVVKEVLCFLGVFGNEKQTWFDKSFDCAYYDYSNVPSLLQLQIGIPHFLVRCCMRK